MKAHIDLLSLVVNTVASLLLDTLDLYSEQSLLFNIISNLYYSYNV